jgi:hypothetical protein
VCVCVSTLVFFLLSVPVYCPSLGIIHGQIVMKLVYLLEVSVIVSVFYGS